MKLGLAHELGMLAATSVSLLLVLAGGEFPVFAWLVLLAPALSFFLKMRGLAAPGYSGALLAVASVVLGFAYLFVRGVEQAVLGGGIALLGLVTARLLTRRTLDHDAQVLLLGLLLGMAGSVLNTGLNYGPLFFVFAVVVIWALATRQLLRGVDLIDDKKKKKDDLEIELREGRMRDRRDVITPAFFAATGFLAIFVLLSTGILFVAFPRINIATFGMRSAGGGLFPNSVSLSGSPRASLGDTTVVARIKGLEESDFDDGLYLRGKVYDVVDTRGFRQSDARLAKSLHALKLAKASVTRTYEVYQQPIDADLLLSLGTVQRANITKGGGSNARLQTFILPLHARDELTATQDLSTAVRFTVTGGLNRPGYVPDDDVEMREADLSHYLKIDDDLDPRVVDLAAQIVGEATTAAEKAAHIRRYLLANYSYTLSQPNGTARAPLIGFLLDDKRGHCEYFATAMALLLRVVDVPTRVIGGYQGGGWDVEGKNAIFTSQNAHSWIEWFHERKGWIVDDATPEATTPGVALGPGSAFLERIRRFWEDKVIDFALLDQLELLRGGGSALNQLGENFPVRRVLATAITLPVAIFLLRWWRRRRREQNSPQQIDRLLGSIVSAVGRIRSRPVADTETIREAVQVCLSSTTDEVLRGVLFDALFAYERARFAATLLNPQHVDAMVENLRQCSSNGFEAEGPRG